MRRFLSAPAMIAVAVTLLAQTSTPAPDKREEHPSSPCQVAGRVVTAADGTPLKSARVALMPEDRRSDHHIYAATSDSDGHFLLKDVVSGRYQFFATHAGFVDQQYQSKGIDSGALLTLRPGQKISDVLFRMTVAAVITGRVTNQDGEAMPRVQVVALRRQTEDEIEDEGPYGSRKQDLRSVSAVPTDDRGQYRIFGLKPGEYYIRAIDSFEPYGNMPVDQSYFIQESLGSEYAPVYYPGVLQLSQAQALSLKPGGEVQADFSMQHVKTVEVAGRVIGPNGPAREAWVRIAQPAGDYGFERQDTTDEKGNFRLKGIPPGSYVVFVYQRGEGYVYEARGQQKIEVGGESIESLTISLGGGTTFHGRVTVAGPGSPKFEHVRVALSPTDEDEQLGASASMKNDGTFEIAAVKDGDYAIHIWGLKDEWYVRSARLGPDDVLENGLHVESGGASGRLDIVVSSAIAQLEGSVTDQDNNALIGARVRVSADPDTPYNRFRWHSTRTDQTGHFSLPGLAPGKYRVIAKYPASSETGFLKSDPQIVILSEHDRKTVQLTIMQPQAK
jgi:hypothetical protein